MEEVAFKSDERPTIFPPFTQIFQAGSGPPLEATSHESVPKISVTRPLVGRTIPLRWTNPLGHKGLGYFSAFEGSLPINRSRSLYVSNSICRSARLRFKPR